jgi:hypothetical protein
MHSMALKNLETKAISEKVVKSNYNDIRTKIVEEMIKKGKNVSPDYMQL